MAGESVLAKMAVYISANTAQFNQQLAITNNKLTAFEKGITGAAKNIGIAFGFTGLVLGLKSVIGSLAGFEHAMSEVKAITQASSSEFTDLRNDALKLGASTKFTAQEVAGLQTAYGRLGFSTKEILNATSATLSLAQATGEDLSKSADVAGSTLRAFGLDAAQMGRVVDVMASSFNKSALGLENFSEAMKYVAPVAANAGLSIEQTTAMLGVLADAGVRGSQAGTSLRKIISDLGQGAAPMLTQKLGDMAKAGLTGADAMSEVGRTAYASLLILANNTPKIENFTGAFNKANGEAKEMARIMQDDLIGDWTKFTSAIDGTIQKAGPVNEVLRSFVQGGTMFAQLLGGTLPEGAQKSSDAFDEVTNRTKKNAKELKDEIDSIGFGAGEGSPYISPVIKDFGKELTKFTEIVSNELPVLETENYLKEKLKALNEAALGQVGSLRAATNQEIQTIQAKIKALQDLGKIQEDQKFNNLNGWGSTQNIPSKTQQVAKPELSNINEWLTGLRSTTTALDEKAAAEDAAAAAAEKHADIMSIQTQAVANLAMAFGDSFGYIMSGAESFSQSIRKMAENVINELFRVAEIAIVTKNVLSLGPGGLIAAAAGLAALHGLVSGILSKGNVSGSGSYSTSQSSTGMTRSADNLHITFSPAKMQGNDLIFAIQKASYTKGRIG